MRMGLFFLAVVLLLAPARATTMRALDEASLVRLSRVVAVVEVVAVEARWMGRRLVTVATLRVSRPVKGARVGDSLEVVVPGGAEGDWVQRVEGAPEPKVGDSCVAFLEDGPGGRLQFLGLEQGFARIRPDASMRGGFAVERTQEARLLGPAGAPAEGPAPREALMPLLERLDRGAGR